MNLKTNLSGVCHVPEIPRGKIPDSSDCARLENLRRVLRRESGRTDDQHRARASSQVVLKKIVSKPAHAHDLFQIYCFHFGFRFQNEMQFDLPEISSVELPHLCANSIKLFVSRAVRAFRSLVFHKLFNTTVEIVRVEHVDVVRLL